MQQAQYESFYAGLMGMSADTMWSQEVEEGKTYEENMKDSILESLENMYLVKQHASEYKVELTDEEKRRSTKPQRSLWKTTHWRTKKLCPDIKNMSKNIWNLLRFSRRWMHQ